MCKGEKALELNKDKMSFTNFNKIVSYIQNASENNYYKDFIISERINTFIWAFQTESEVAQIEEYTHQMMDMIETIYEQKNIMISEIDVSYLYSSQLQLFCTERAKVYMNALERIEAFFPTKNIYNYIMQYKNL